MIVKKSLVEEQQQNKTVSYTIVIDESVESAGCQY